MLVADGERGESRFPGTVKMRSNPMGFGSSGGGWWAPSQGGGIWRMIGLSFFSLPSEPSWKFGPVFDDTVKDLVDHMLPASSVARRRSAPARRMDGA